MVIELTFESVHGKVRKVEVLVKEDILTELIGNNETLIKLIRRERKSEEVLTSIRDLDV